MDINKIENEIQARPLLGVVVRRNKLWVTSRESTECVTKTFIRTQRRKS